MREYHFNITNNKTIWSYYIFPNNKNIENSQCKVLKMILQHNVKVLLTAAISCQAFKKLIIIIDLANNNLNLNSSSSTVHLLCITEDLFSKIYKRPSVSINSSLLMPGTNPSLPKTLILYRDWSHTSRNTH